MARALLVSTYDLGHQPFGLASPAAWLKREGLAVDCVDVAKEKLSDDTIRRADLIAFHLPMHTATRMAGPLIRKSRAQNAGARICAYGLYAPLNEAWLRTLGVDDVFGAEFEEDLACVARRVADAAAAGRASATPPGAAAVDPVPPAERPIAKLRFIAPDRSGLPPLTRYSTLQMPDGSRRTAGYTEASRGCLHLCRHCPVVPIYNGQFRIVQADVVLEDVAGQVAAGAQHVTFGDPDFLNGPTHARRLVEAVHERFPALTYDVTIKIEHLLKHPELVSVLRDTGCLFVTSAVESIDDRVLVLLDKGHTREGFERAVRLCRDAGLPLVPTFVPFHPWMTMDDYCELLDELVALDLVDHVAPIQLAIRLLVPSASRLLDLREMREVITDFDQRTLTHRWAHPDPRVDALQSEISALVGRRLTSHRRELFEAIRTLACERAGRPAPAPLDAARLAPVPVFDEPWYCCAEPNPEQLTLV